jgi:predicted transcriptional regulator
MTVVSTRIDDDLKEQIEEYGINASEVAREALAAEVTRRRRERLKERGQQFKGALRDSGVTTEDIVATIREDRDADLEDR